MNMIEKFGENTVLSEIARSNRYGNDCFELLVECLAQCRCIPEVQGCAINCFHKMYGRIEA